MGESRAGDPLDPTDASTPGQFIEKLRDLRLWAGSPSLRRLRQLAGTTADDRGRPIDILPTSTSSYILRSDRLPRMEFVRAFVTACLRVRGRDNDTMPEVLEHWYQAWRRLHQSGPAVVTSPPPQVPRQLPFDVAGFTGRSMELALLEKAFEAAHQPGPIVISAIDGMAGIGKTALAVHAAHRVADRFPDGQLFIDLHGFTEAVTPVEPADALDRLLRAMGVPGERIPTELDDRAGLWRSTLAGRRVLIVLDNAATEAQVAPLLPGRSGCLVLVTSRRHLTSLDDAHAVSLDTLPVEDAVTLFSHIVGEHRIANQPREQVLETVMLCGRLPLAIRIAAGRLRSRPAWRVADLVERLSDQDQRLAVLEAGAGTRSVTSALELSYRQLTAEQQRAYRLLGLHPGPGIDPYAAAALVNTTLGDARRLLDQLLDAHLLQERAPDRYVFHDLVRAHAASAAARHETEADRRAALARLLDHYRYTASVAMDSAYPYERDRRPRVPTAETPTPDLSDPALANAWLDAELPNLLAAARYAAAHPGWPEITWHLSAILRRHLRARERYRDAKSLHWQALTTARTNGDRTGELHALNGLGWAHRQQGQRERALDHFRQALEIARIINNHIGEIDALIGVGAIHTPQGRYEQGFDHFHQALEIARTTGDRTGELDALNGLSWIHHIQGRYEQASRHSRLALEVAHAIGHRSGEMDALRGLGDVYRLQGRYEQAIDHLEQALTIARTTNHRASEWASLSGLGHIRRLQGRYEQAIDHFAQALEIARATGDSAGEFDALYGLGWVHRLQGRHQLSADCHEQVLETAREIGDRNWQFEALHGLGRLHHATGHIETALAHHREALALATDLDQPADQVRSLDGLARAHRDLGQPEPARRHWQQALEILASLGTEYTEDEEASAATIRTHLAALDQPRPPGDRR